MILLSLLVACGPSAPPLPPGQTASEIRVTFCDKAEKTRLVRVGIGGANNIGETEVLPDACVDNGRPLGCTFANVTPGTYRVQDGLSSALVYAGPAPSPAGDAVVELACQAECTHTLTVTADPRCAASPDAPSTTGTVRVYTAEPAPIATEVGTYPWTAGTDIALTTMMCTRLVAEVDVPGCATNRFPLTPAEAKNRHALKVEPLRDVALTVNDAAGKPVAGAYVSDDTFRTAHTDARGNLTLHRRADAPSGIWVQATGFAGGLFPVPADGPMTVTLAPTHPVTVRCTEANAPCAGPAVFVGSAVSPRGCVARNAAEWTCDAADTESVWARKGTAVSPKVPVSGTAPLTVAL